MSDLLTLSSIKKAIMNPQKAKRMLYARGRYYLTKLLYHISPEKALPPGLIAVVINESCNLRCKMCDLGSKTESYAYETIREKGDMPLELFKKLVDSVAHYRPEIFIVCTEPLLYPHIIKAIEYGVKKGLRMQITTNGVLLKKLAEGIVKSGLHQLNVSLDSGNPEVHDYIRGVPGTFKTVVEGIQEVQSLRKKFNTEHPKIGIVTCISNHNFYDSEKSVAVFSKLNVDHINVEHLSYVTEEVADFQNKNYPDFPVSPTSVFEVNPFAIDIDVLRREVRKIKEKYKDTSVGFPIDPSDKQIETYYRKPLEPIDGYQKCLYPWRFCWVFPDGDVLGSWKCFNRKMGNINEKNILEIWKDKPYREFRRDLKKIGTFPSCYRCVQLFSSNFKGLES